MELKNLKNIIENSFNKDDLFAMLIELGVVDVNKRDKCPHCQIGTKVLAVRKSRNTGRHYLCDNISCKKRSSSIFYGTYFDKKCISTELIIIGCFINKRKICHVVLDWGFDSKTVETTYAYLRQKCSMYQKNNVVVIGGVGSIVEIDETHLFKRKYNRGRVLSAKNVWIFGIIERRSKKVYVEIVQKRDRNTLYDIIIQHASEDTIIMTDGRRGYVDIHENYETYSVNHKLHFVDPGDPSIHTNNIERLWRSLKNEIRGSFGNTYYDAINLFMFRRNYLNSNFYENMKLLLKIII